MRKGWLSPVFCVFSGLSLGALLLGLVCSDIRRKASGEEPPRLGRTALGRKTHEEGKWGGTYTLGEEDQGEEDKGEEDARGRRMRKARGRKTHEEGKWGGTRTHTHKHTLEHTNTGTHKV